MIRVFVAFPVRDLIAESFLQVSKNNSNLKNLRWTPRDNLHVTLFFIGEVEEHSLELIKDILGKFFQNQKSFSLDFEEIAVKMKKKSGMIWAAFKRNDSFSKISEDLYQSVKEFMTIERSHADPIPHCTLARIKSEADVALLGSRIDLQNKNLKVNSAELWKTVQTKEGVKYESLTHYLLVD